MRSAPQAVPHSAGTRRPATAAPDAACDAHIHAYDPRFPAFGAAPLPDRATIDDYRLLQERIGTQRVVVVQPRAHGTDNRATLAAIRAIGTDRARGVAVVRPEASDAELRSLHAGGIRGIRFSLHTAIHAATDFSMVEPLAHRVRALGWHVQLHWSADQIVAHAALLARLPGTVVMDHLARLPQPDPRAHGAFGIVRGLLGNGRTWIKLSGAYLDSKDGAAGGYADTVDLAQAWIAAAPDRMVWGSDWPHPTEVGSAPDDAALFDLLARWAPDPAVRHRILVENPARLYDFPPRRPEETSACRSTAP